MIVGSIVAAIEQAFDRRFLQVFILGISLTVLFLFGLSAGLVWTVSILVGDSVSVPYFGELYWLADLASLGAAVALLVLSIFLMIPVAALILPFLLDRVAQAVEDEVYPMLPEPREVSILDNILDSIRLLAVLVIANLFACILYLLLLFLLPPAAPLAFWAINGFLLGREYFTLAAMRRVGRQEAKILRSRYALKIWAAGFLMAVPLSVPLLNLVIPILGAATFTHLFHRLSPQAPYDRTSPDRVR